MFNNSTILITGGTGSFGHVILPMLLENYNPKKIIIFSRDEMKQWEMAKICDNDSRVSFFIGDVRDRDRLYRAFDGVDYVVHAAATKIVPTAEYNPFECIKTNVMGAMNVIDAAIDKGVKKVVALSTDKAAAPINLYGATKLCSDKLFIAANNIKGFDGTSFSVVRYGNVFGSRGSIVDLLKKKNYQKTFNITDLEMTRFNITLEQSVSDVLWSLANSPGGDILVPKLKSYKVEDLIMAYNEKLKLKVIGVRPGEKIHEEMITASDSLNTIELKKYYVILPNTFSEGKTLSTRKFYKSKFKSKNVKKGFTYNSSNNPDFLSIK